jgi:hypothetical protein
MAWSAGMNPSLRGNGTRANGMIAANATSTPMLKASATFLCRGEAGTEAMDNLES